MRLIEISLRHRPAIYWLLILAAVTVAAVLLSMLLSWRFETRGARTVMVSAKSSRIALTVLEDQSPFLLGETRLCLPRANPGRARAGRSATDCDPAGWIEVLPGAPLPAAADVQAGDWPMGSTWPGAAVLDPPVGTRIEFEVVGGNAEIRFLALPEGRMPAPGIVAGARLLKTTREMQERGRYLILAQLELGSPPGTSMRGYVSSGEIAFRAPAMFTYGWRSSASILLREDKIPAGGFVSFVDLSKDDAPSAMNVQLIANAADEDFDIQAVNVPAPTAAKLQYVGTEPLLLVPLWTELLSRDPFLKLLSGLAALTGLGALLRAIGRRGRE